MDYSFLKATGEVTQEGHEAVATTLSIVDDSTDAGIAMSVPAKTYPMVHQEDGERVHSELRTPGGDAAMRWRTIYP